MKLPKVLHSAHLRLLAFAATGALILLFSGSCQKEESHKYNAEITVKTYTDSVPVQNALVRFTAPVSSGESRLREFYVVTDLDGKCTLHYDAEAVYEVNASRGSWRGCSHVALKQGETVKKTVYIYPWELRDRNNCPQPED